MTTSNVRSDERWKNTRLSRVDLSVRTSNCLNRTGLTTLGELSALSDAELLRQPGFGRKCLGEVRKLLSSTGSLTLREERANGEGVLDFLTIKEPILSRLLRPVQSLELTKRASDALDNGGITTIGELVQLTERDLCRRRNVGRSTINTLESVLAQVDLSLGIAITNWPKKEQLAKLLESRAEGRLDQRHSSSLRLKFLEDELCDVVRAVVGASDSAIVIRRTGWDGKRIWTLEELASNPIASGRTSPVSRQRIRQIEDRAFSKIQKERLSTPILDRAITLIEANAPLAAVTLPSLFQEHGISQCGLSYEALCAAIEAFQLDWDLERRNIGKDVFMLPSEGADGIECSWKTLVEAAVDQDFVAIDQFANVAGHTKLRSLDIAVSGVSSIPSLDWLDQERRIYWSLDRVKRGWNKAINVCRKILTVAPEVPLRRLVAAVKRARTVRDLPPESAFINMLLASGEFGVGDGMVSRGASFRPEPLSKTDRLMITAATDAGTVTTFKQLRDVLVRRDLSANHAQVLMVVSPFWITTARGKYRFVGKQAHLNKFRLKKPLEVDEVQDCPECLVELEINHRHLVAGRHRIDENLVKRGRWSLRDERGNDIGTINVTARMINGLDRVFSLIGGEVGMFVIIDFSSEEFTAIMLW